jgi:hypothetical protein
VAVNAAAEYEIWDPTGGAIANLRPALKIGEATAAGDVARRLIHLSKYHAVQQLANHDPLSPLARKLEVELVGKIADYDPADPFEDYDALDEPGGTPTVTVGEWVGLRIKNASTRKLNVTVFDLQPDYGATQIFPMGEGDAFVEFEPGVELILPLEAYLPEGYQEGKDILKAFATVGTSNFRWMALPALDQPLVRKGGLAAKSPANPLEEMVAAFTADQPKTRHLKPATYPSKEWVTAQVELRMRKP